MPPIGDTCAVCAHDIEHVDEAVRLSTDDLAHEFCAEQCPTCCECQEVTHDDDAAERGWSYEVKADRWTCETCAEAFADAAREMSAQARIGAAERRDKRMRRVVRTFAHLVLQPCIYEAALPALRCESFVWGETATPCPPCAARRALRAAAKEVVR